jgi:LytR cell envelope-related transcriptional attenuator
MSMLTPPGMGGKYRITGDVYPRMRRPRGRRKIVFGTVGAVVAIGLIGWGTAQLIDVFSGSSTTVGAAHGPADCRIGQGGQSSTTGPQGSADPLPKPADITVNVLNATQRNGLAKRTADALRKRGFKIGEVTNAPASYDMKLKTAGILLGAHTNGSGAYRVLATEVHGVKTKNDGRKGKDIDLILGSGFSQLTSKKNADAAQYALAHPSPVPSASGC